MKKSLDNKLSQKGLENREGAKKNIPVAKFLHSRALLRLIGSVCAQRTLQETLTTLTGLSERGHTKGGDKRRRFGKRRE